MVDPVADAVIAGPGVGKSTSSVAVISSVPFVFRTGDHAAPSQT
jgi:hypothetical protein